MKERTIQERTLRSAARNLVGCIKAAFVYQIIATILVLVGTPILTQETTILGVLQFVALGYSLTYLTIFVGTVFPFLLSFEGNRFVENLCILLQVSAPFIGLTATANQGLSVTPIAAVLFVVTVVVIRWNKIRGDLLSLFALIGKEA